MTVTRTTDISPVLVLSTGRCGSTMISDLLSRHPAVLSLSEFFVPLGPEAFAHDSIDGDGFWRILSRQSPALRAMLRDGIVVDEMLYPYDQPGMRYGLADLPPMMMVTLPHLTDAPEALYDALEPVVRARPAMPIADQYRALFEDLAGRLGRRVWIERSGGSLMLAAKLLRLFPDARVIHVHRDGRDTAMSMEKHHNFKVLVGAMKAARRLGVDATREFTRDRGRRLDVLSQRMIFPFINARRLAEGVTLPELGAFWSLMIGLAREVLDPLPPDRLLTVAFEDVQRAPREQLQAMIRFIDPGLDDPAWLDEVSAIPRPARSRAADLPPDVYTALTEACRPGLEALGYPV